MLVYLIHIECSHGMTNSRSVKALIIGDTPGAILSTGGKKSVEHDLRIKSVAPLFATSENSLYVALSVGVHI